MTTNIQPVCGPCTRERADVVRHAEPCEESVYKIRLHRVQAGLANLQEDLRACITEARATHREAQAAVLIEVLANIEQESRAVRELSPPRAREGTEAEAGPSHFSEVDDAICGFDDGEPNEDVIDDFSAEHRCIKCGREAIINGLCAMCSELHPEVM